MAIDNEAYESLAAILNSNGKSNVGKSAEAERVKLQAESRAKAQAESRAKAQAESRAKAQAEARAKAQAEVRAKAQAEARAKAQAEARAKAQAEARAKARAKAQAEARAKAQAEARAKAQAEARAKAQAEARAKAQAEARAKAQAEARKDKRVNGGVIHTDPSDAINLKKQETYSTDGLKVYKFSNSEFDNNRIKITKKAIAIILSLLTAGGTVVASGRFLAHTKGGNDKIVVSDEQNDEVVAYYTPEDLENIAAKKINNNGNNNKNNNNNLDDSNRVISDSEKELEDFLQNDNQGKLVEKYCKQFGIDPMLFASLCKTESNLDHYSCIPGGSMYNGAGVGLCQIESPDGSSLLSCKDINGKTMSILNSMDNMCKLDYNILAGVIIFRDNFNRLYDSWLLDYSEIDSEEIKKACYYCSTSAYNMGLPAILYIGYNYDVFKDGVFNKSEFQRGLNDIHNDPSVFLGFNFDGKYGDNEYSLKIFNRLAGRPLNMIIEGKKCSFAFDSSISENEYSFKKNNL